MTPEAYLTELPIEHFCHRCGGSLCPGDICMRAVFQLGVSEICIAVGIAWHRSCWLAQMGPSGKIALQRAEAAMNTLKKCFNKALP